MSKYQCSVCGKYKKPNKDNFIVGDKVTFAVVKELSHYTRILTKTGKVEWVKDLYVGVRAGNKVFIRKFSEVNPSDAPSILTYALFGLCECEAQAENPLNRSGTSQ
jgi:hypothetical protein